MRRRRYSPEEREHALRAIRDSARPAAAVARNLGISASTLRRWVREAQGREWAGRVDRYFGFLTRYGFAVSDIDASNWWAVRVIYRSPRSAVEVVRSVEFQRVEVRLMRLVDGDLPAYPIFIVDSVPVHTFFVDDLPRLRADGEGESATSLHGLRPQEVATQLAFWSDVLSNHGADFLAGDLSVLDELELTVRDRASRHRQEVTIWLPDGASASEEARAIDDVMRSTPEGVAVVARRYRRP